MILTPIQHEFVMHLAKYAFVRNNEKHYGRIIELDADKAKNNLHREVMRHFNKWIGKLNKMDPNHIPSLIKKGVLFEPEIILDSKQAQEEFNSYSNTFYGINFNKVRTVVCVQLTPEGKDYYDLWQSFKKL
jgi:hypothetical protein